MTEAAVVETVEEEVAPERDLYDFDGALQAKIVALMLRDTLFLVRVAGLIEPDFFELEADGHIAKLALDYFHKYRKSPHVSVLKTVLKDYFDERRIKDETLKAAIAKRLLLLMRSDISDVGIVTDKVVEFAKDRAIGLAIIASVEDKEKKDYAAIRKRMETALLVGADDGDKDYDYYKEIESRTETRKGRIAGIIKRDGISTGYDEIDKVLMHHGWGRKEFSLIMGAAKAGKSMSLGDFAKNASIAGYNVAYLTCEVADEIIADRLDANIAGVLMKKLDDNAHAVQAAIDKIEGTAGRLVIHEYPTGTLKASMIRRFLERQRSKGIIIDLLVVDYADIMAPEFRTPDPIENSKSIYVDLRGIASEYNLALLSATQTNREGAKKMTAGATDVAEDFNRIRIVDICISINASEAEKAAGEARLFFAASRNTEGEFTIRIKQNRSMMRFIEKVLGRE